ncbi:MAG: hypothetical protein DWQ02_20910 [Bacteroidetes bacterium]|nr:MAG: hypothetical protein DWQ02_20910 [Bacteroidota bacterium]
MKGKTTNFSNMSENNKKHKKFKILILDDLKEGSDRVIGLLVNKKYLPLGINKGYISDEGLIINKDAPIDVYLWGGATTMAFDTILKVLKDYSHALKTGENTSQRTFKILNRIDAIFIDLKWDNEDVIYASKTLTKEKWETLALENKEESTSFYIAGLELLKALGKTDHLKALFSGAHENLLLRYLIIKYLAPFMVDNLLVGNISDDSYWDEIDQGLRSRLLKEQNRVINQLSDKEILELENRVKSQKDFDLFDIRHYEKIDGEDYFWSLQTLFPRETMKIESAPTPNLEKQAKDELLHLLSNFPKLLSFITGYVAHPNNEKEKIRQGEFLHKVKLLLFKEFKKVGLEKNSIDFDSIKPFLDYLMRPENKSAPVKFRDHLLDYNWYFLIVWPGEGFRDKIRMWMNQAGFYPGHLDYIFKIAINNAEIRNQIVEEIKVRSAGDKFVFCIKSKDKANAAIPIGIEALKTKIDKIKLNLEFKAPFSEGLEDIIKIVCYLYRGEFIFKSKDKQIICKFYPETGKICSKVSPKETKDLDETRVAYEFHIPKILKIYK